MFSNTENSKNLIDIDNELKSPLQFSFLILNSLITDLGILNLSGLVSNLVPRLISRNEPEYVGLVSNPT